MSQGEPTPQGQQPIKPHGVHLNPAVRLSKRWGPPLSGKLYQSSTYDDQFRVAQKALKAEEAIEDVDFFFRLIEEAHPRPLAYISPEAYLELKKGINNRITASAAESGTVSKSSLAIELAKAAASLQDGHTSLHPGFLLADPSDPAPCMLPFRLDYRLGGLYVDRTLAEEKQLQDREILQFDDIKAFDYLTEILSAISGERFAKKMTSFISDQRTYWALLAPRDSQTVVLTTRDGANQVYTDTLDLISVSKHDSLLQAVEEERVADFWTLHHDSKTCYYRFDSFDNSEQQRAFADSLFQEIRDLGIRNLIIDIRFNGGGNSSFGDYLLDYITNEPYRNAARMDVKLSNHLYETYPHYQQFEELTGQVISRDVDPNQPSDRGYLFDGDVFVLTSPRTFSSAGMLAATVKDYGLGTLIGEETGATRQGFGENLAAMLPNSGMNFNLSCKEWFAPIPQPGDERSGTVPHIPLDDTVLEKYPDSTDPVLSYVLEYVASERGDP